jgi:hypothetical protein
MGRQPHTISSQEWMGSPWEEHLTQVEVPQGTAEQVGRHPPTAANEGDVQVLMRPWVAVCPDKPAYTDRQM